MKSTFFLAVCIAAIVVGDPAYAQGPYVSGSFMGDVVRVSRSSDPPFRIGNGEVGGFGVRLGTPVWSRFGVEAELARPSQISSDGVPSVLVRSASSVDRVIVNPGGSVTIISPNRTETRTRYTTLSTLAWMRQPLTARLSLSYLGGLAFLRTTRDSELGFGIVQGAPGLPVPSPLRLEAVDYDVRPVVGVDARVGLAAHLDLVSGMRLLSLENGWLVRPSVGVGWAF